MASAYHRKKGWVPAAEAGVSRSASGMSAQDVLFGFGKMAATVQEASSATDDSGK